MSSHAMSTNPLLELGRLGQSVWLDDITRGMLDEGLLAALIEHDGVTGLTSNPAIFAEAMMKDPRYGAAIASLVPSTRTATELFEALAVDDLRRAADLFRPAYEKTDGRDGYVSMEVSPQLAYDARLSVTEACRLWNRLDRPNAMIKIPGTVPGLEAIRELIASGINVNVTLLFSPDRYQAAAEAYLSGIEDRLAAGRDVSRVASVASFFVSRIDTLVDAQLDELFARGQPAAKHVRGKAAVACACRAYEVYTEILASERWQRLQSRGARMQRLLWASTSTKDPAYSPVKYVDELVAPDTVVTIPLKTLEAYRRLGRPEVLLEHRLAQASDEREALERLGIDLEQVADTLEQEGVRKFIEPFERLQRWLEEQRGR